MRPSMYPQSKADCRVVEVVEEEVEVEVNVLISFHFKIKSFIVLYDRTWCS